jgi:hypothetical protein
MGDTINRLVKIKYTVENLSCFFTFSVEAIPVHAIRANED